MQSTKESVIGMFNELELERGFSFSNFSLLKTSCVRKVMSLSYVLQRKLQTALVLNGDCGHHMQPTI